MNIQVIQPWVFDGLHLARYLKPSDYKQSWDVELADVFHNFLHVFAWKSSEIGCKNILLLHRLWEQFYYFPCGSGGSFGKSEKRLWHHPSLSFGFGDDMFLTRKYTFIFTLNMFTWSISVSCRSPFCPQQGAPLARPPCHAVPLHLRNLQTRRGISIGTVSSVS